MIVVEIEVERLRRKLQSNAFGELTGEEYKYLVYSLVDECRKTEFLGGRERVGFDTLYSLVHTETFEQALVKNLGDCMDPKDRVVFSVFYTELCENANQFAETLYPYRELLLELLDLSYRHGKFIDGGVAIDIVRNRNRSPKTRQLAAMNLIGRDFRSSAPEKTWDEIEKNHLPECTLLAAPIIARHLDTYTGLRGTKLALTTIAKIRKPTKPERADELLKIHICRAFDRCLELDGGRIDYKKITEGFTQTTKNWVAEILKDADLSLATTLYLPTGTKVA